MSITHPITVPTSVAGPANEMLAEKLSSIPGVRVSTRTSRPLGEMVFEVAVDEGNNKGEMEVYQAELEVHQRFPDARIELYVV